MIRTVALSAAALMGVSLLVPLSTAVAAAETCQGQPASIVGASRQPLIGTEGPDVIVTNSASEITALGGDDLICVTGPPLFTSRAAIQAGAGDDSVEVATVHWSTTTDLGAGADTFVATNEHQHYVTTGEGAVDTESDVVRIAGGNAYVSTGQAGTVNADVIDIGFGYGHVSWGGIQAAPGSVTGGGDSTLFVRLSSADASVDARAGTLTSAENALAFTGFTGFVAWTTAEEGRFTFLGSHRDERLQLLHVGERRGWGHGRDIVMGGGDDFFESDTLGSKDSQLRGSGGRDHVLLNLLDLPHHRVDADLERSEVVATKGPSETVVGIPGFEDLSLGARRAEVNGTENGERIVVSACQARVTAHAGRDSTYFTDELSEDGGHLSCTTYRAVTFGGRGNDTLAGTWGDDRLIGGPGRDDIDGRIGRDICQGEKVRDCEKRI